MPTYPIEIFKSRSAYANGDGAVLTAERTHTGVRVIISGPTHPTRSILLDAAAAKGLARAIVGARRVCVEIEHRGDIR
jgi:hypothetical protein